MLRIENLKKSFGNKLLFEGACYHFPEGERIALVGANGAGKTSLLNLLSGVDQPDDGQILKPSKTRVGYLPQKPNPHPRPTILTEGMAGATETMELKERMDEAMAKNSADAYEKAEAAFRLSGGYSLESKATSILTGLGFKQQDLGRSPTELSGGWRMRLELARLFLREPDFLILDEPTNHLDLPSLVWVESYLAAFRGTLLFVSHDKALLNRLATITLHLHAGRLTPYRGNFDAFLVSREERMEQEQAERDQLRRRREQMERFVERFGAKASKATQAQSRMKMIARIRDVEDNLSPEDMEASVFIQIPEPPKVPRVVYQVEKGAIGYSSALASGIDLLIEKGAKIAVIGANGIGKSTLLRTIDQRIPSLAGAWTPGAGVGIAYFAQDQNETLNPNDGVLTNLMRSAEISEKAARSMLGGFLFRGDDVFKKTSVLSGGELSRLGLACALAKRAGFLLLDEPTNHLDMASVETLGASIDAYEGTILFVSHDRTFIDEVATHIFAMLPDGRSMLFPGKLADYARLAAVAGFPNVLATDDPKKTEAKAEGGAAKTSGGLTEDQVRDMKRARQKLGNRITTLDGIMATRRKALALISEQMVACGAADFAKARQLHDAQEKDQAALDEAENEWLEASDELERIVSKLTEIGRA